MVPAKTSEGERMEQPIVVVFGIDPGTAHTGFGVGLRPRAPARGARRRRSTSLRPPTAFAVGPAHGDAVLRLGSPVDLRALPLGALREPGGTWGPTSQGAGGFLC
jgi:hypothetical protein